MMRYLGLICAFAALLAFSTFAVAANKTCTGGNMSVGANWGGAVPAAGDTLRINGNCVVDNAFSNLAYGTLEVSRSAAGTVSWPAAGANTLRVTTVLTGSNGAGTIDMTNGGTLQITTGWTSTNTSLVAGTGTVNWNVTGANSTLPANVSAYNNLTITAGARTANIGTGTTVGGLLTLTSGTLVVGANTLTLNGPAIAGTATNLSTDATSSLVFGGSSAGISIPSSVAALNNLTINNSNGVPLNGGLTLSGTLTLSSGTFAVGANTLALNGPPIAGTATNLNATSVSSLSFGGSSSSVSIPSNITSLTNLTINNANGVTLNNADMTVGGTLTLTSGALNAGSNTVTTTTNCNAGSVSRSAGYVSGKLQLKFPSGTNIACTYYIGSGAIYAPIAMTMTSTGGTLTGSTTGNEHPQISASTIDPTQDANRYWALWDTGDTISATSYGVTFTFVNGDLDSNATATNFIVGKYTGGSWTTPTPVTSASLSTGVTGLAGPITSTVNFAVGEANLTCPVPSDLPNTMTCVCDNFGRSMLNPSTIFGSNWNLSSSSGSFGVPHIVNSGYLRLTDANTSGNEATAATLPGSFPAAGNMIAVEFKQYAYGGNGADGIALTLSDASIAPQPGAYGGSLGYAQKNNASCATPPCNGFAGGWIGIGFDEFGNYSAAAEGRSGGIGATADSVAVRGSGSGLTGYPYLGGTGTLTPGIDNTGSATPAYGHAYRVVVDASNYLPASKKAQVSVYRDTTGAGSFSAGNRIINFDAYTANPAQDAVPTSWKLSFTGSTGGAYNIHEIGGLKICAQSMTPPPLYRIEVDNTTPSTCTTSPAGKPIVTVTAVDTSGNVITNYTKTVTLSATLANGSASSATWSVSSANGTLSGTQYTFVAADNGVAKFFLTDATAQTIYITVSENGSTNATTFGTPITYSTAAFSVATTDTLSTGVVAGRSHLMSITRLNSCVADTTYTGAKSLDGWYSTALDHPSGANAPQICAPNAGGTCLPTTGACQTISIASPNLDATNNNLPSLNFASGVANFCLVTSDIGKYSLSLRDDSNVAAPITGSSATLTVRPFAVAVSNLFVTGTATGNPANNASSGSIFTSAGTDFQASVGGYLWNSAADSNNDGLPDSAATLSQVTAGGYAPHYADTVTLAPDTSSSAKFAPNPGAQGSLANGSVAVTGGSATPSTLEYSEVGSFTLTAKPSTSYLNSGVDLSNRVVIYANPSAGAGATQTGWVGRFTPDHFTISGGALVNRTDLSCSSSIFTYMGEPIGTSFTLTAMNKSGGTTANYAGSYAKFTNSTASWTALGSNDSVGLWMLATGYPVSPGTCKAIFSNTTPSTTSFSCAGVANPSSISRAAGPRVTVSAPSMSWTSGVGTLAANATLERADAVDGSYDTLNIGVKPRDSDGITLASGLNLDADNDGTSERISLGSTRLRYGKLKINNTYGSELLPLSIDLVAEYWNGTAYVSNTDDSCTPLANTNFSWVQGSGSTITTTVVGGNTLSSGVGKIQLSKPSNSVSGKGSVVLSTSASGTINTYLPGSGVETFGVYKSGPVIYLRELY